MEICICPLLIIQSNIDEKSFHSDFALFGKNDIIISINYSLFCEKMYKRKMNNEYDIF